MSTVASLRNINQLAMVMTLETKNATMLLEDDHSMVTGLSLLKSMSREHFSTCVGECIPCQVS